MSSALDVKRHGPVTILTLNRPARYNALDDNLLALIRDALRDAEVDPGVRALVLTGTGRAFCSGADLSADGSHAVGEEDVLALPEPERTAALRHIGEGTRDGLLQRFHPLVRQIREGKPVVAAVNGTAAGGGVGLALACDIVLAARSANFTQVFAPRLGLVPDCGVTWQLPRTVGSGAAMALALLGEPLPADEAARLGLIWRAVDDSQLLTEALRTASRLAANPAHVNGMVKRLLRDSPQHSFAQQLDAEAFAQGECGAQPSFVEGVRAFQQKREPVFYPEA